MRKFNEKWLENDEFSWWLKPVPENVYKANCAVCRRRFKLGTMGIKAVESHTQSGKHWEYARARKKSSIEGFCSTLSISKDVTTDVENPQPATPSSDLHVVFGSTLRAEECVQQLDLRDMISVSMDGPSVNWKFLEIFQQEHSEAFGGAQLTVVGSCGLHILHNAIKSGFSVWQMEKVLRALHTVFHNSPARREDFCTLTKTSVFPLPFCGHCWIENLPVIDRAIAVWPMIVMYVDAVTKKKLPNPRTSSYDFLAEARHGMILS
ncbi:uncharacterized protein LOC131538809 [Onychostoma macrolepis]|uniref:uncharacterized protein LOC131538809 n=1 Tax=Onychostoma macrolepis TaxID=369639 RepID=UPI00272CFCE5|nr:uncharacterized protein LOC131538809 [Onychostoma macrolepis]